MNETTPKNAHAGPRPSRLKRFWNRGGWVIAMFLVYILVREYSLRGVADGPAPVIDTVTLSGKPFSIQQAAGKPLLLHFWASWCPICEAEEGSIDAIAKDHQVMTVAMQSGDKAEVAAYLNKQSLSFPVILDEHGDLAREYGVRGVPMTFFIDSRGNISHVEKGFSTEPGMRARLWMTD